MKVLQQTFQLKLSCIVLNKQILLHHQTIIAFNGNLNIIVMTTVGLHYNRIKQM